MAYSTITKPADYFLANLHTGTGSSQNITTGLDMSTNGGLVWNKVRSTTNNHVFCDTVRGATKLLHSDLNLAEYTDATSVTSFNSDGWTGGGGGNTNGSGQTFVSWNWLAGGTASSNTDGSITSSVSASTTSGFSIVSYTGTGSAATIGHGLGVAPKMIIFKSIGSTDDWKVYHTSIGATKWLKLNTTEAAGTSSGNFNDTEPTSTVFSVGNGTGTNNTNGMIAYCFAEKKGFSKFGNYIGNGSADGTFVYTGFRPALFIVKNISVAGYNWEIRDNKRDSYNAIGYRLEPNTSNAEAAYYAEYDFVSNGIKIRANGNNYNTSGSTYIYMAFAESPLVSNTGGGIPATAR